MKTTLLIHVDALRPDYVTEKEMPFLDSLRTDGTSGVLVPPFGFEPDGAYLTGTSPENYLGGAHFVLASGRTVIPFGLKVPQWMDGLDIYSQYALRKIVGWIIGARASSKRVRANPGIAQIPFGLLHWFDFSEHHFPHEPEFCGSIPTIYDHVRDNKGKFFYHGYPEFHCTAEVAHKRVCAEFADRMDFGFVLISDLDDAGHREGPHSAATRKAVADVDKAIEGICVHVRNTCDELDVIIFGDHGMVRVEYLVDVWSALKGAKPRLGIDYVMFLDSTMARFWFFNTRAENEIRSLLIDLDGGSVVSEEETDRYCIDYPDRRLGDCIYWAHGGTMLFPNFWHVRKPKKGMHGYRAGVSGNHGALICHNSSAKPSAEVGKQTMPDLFQTVMYSLYGKPCVGPHVLGQPLQMAYAARRPS